MLAILVRKELLANLLTLRLGVAVIFTVVLSVMTTFIGSLDYSRNVEAYKREVRKAAEELDKATVYSQVVPRIVVPPQPLAILCRGVRRTSGQQVEIELGWLSLSSWGLSEDFDSQFMKTLVQIDFTTVVALLLSFLAVVLGFDGICGECESGTLKQLLTNPVPRGHIVLAKLFGGMLSLWLPFALAFVISLLIVLANPDVVLTGSDWVRLGIFFALSCLFLGQVFALSLMVSSFTRESATSLIVCLFLWLIGGVGYINLLPSFSRYGVDEPPFQEFMDQLQELGQNYSREIETWEANNPGPGEAYLRGLERDGRLRYAHPQGYAWLQRRNAFAVNKQLEMADRRHRYHWANWEPLAREAYLVDDWAVLSPFTNYQVLSYQLAQTSLDDMFFLGRAGRHYRQTFISYLRSKQAFSSRRWFTDDPPDQEPMIPDPEAVTSEMLAPDSPFMQARMSWAEEQEKKAAEDDRRQLDLSDMPKFGGESQRSLTASLDMMTPGLAVLLLSFGVSVLITLTCFLRYDPG